MTSVVVFSSGRADYFILRALIIHIIEDSRFQVRVVCPREAFLFEEGQDSEDTPNKDAYLVFDDLRAGSVTSLMSNVTRLVANYSRILDSVRPSLVILLGDRYETLLFATLSKTLNSKLCHFHGGEVTEGSLDDYYRNAITKLSDIHFVQDMSAKRNLLKLGEQDASIYVIGPLWLTNLSGKSHSTKHVLDEKFGIPFTNNTILVTWHPNTTCPKVCNDELKIILAAIEKFPHCSFIFTAPNNDLYGEVLGISIKAFCEKNVNCHYVDSFGIYYYSVMNNVDLMMGNSSSGLIEFPYYGKPTLNIGDRQRGRFRHPSVIDCDVSLSDIVDKIKLVIDGAPSRINGNRDYEFFPSRNGPVNTLEFITERLYHLCGQT